MLKPREKPALLAVLSGVVLLTAPASGRVEDLIRFREIAELGFGDRQNSKAWAMIWWKNDLYVGTARAHLCMDYAGLAILRPERYEYPPDDPDLECTPTPQDLPLQAEIWRYTPETNVWERVFQSPNDVQIPLYPDKFTARDAGIRNLIAFTDPDGQEALYAAGITSESINPGMPPPRILRTTDGRNWEPVPQDPGTVLGDLGRRQANFRAAEVYKRRLYIVNGNLRGTGALLEAENPAGGNDNFRWVSPPDMHIFEMAVYNNFLYLGLGTPDGYAVVKTDAEGTPPYRFTTVVDKGGYVGRFKSFGAASMYVYQGRLYVGTDKPPELIRINPDDSWDLIVGKPRKTPSGWKEPLSGLGRGFDYLLANHFHRMVEHEGKLYLSTNDAAGFLKEFRVGRPFLDLMGFDLLFTPDGVDYRLLTLTGLDRPFDLVMRVLASTPFGLFAGTSNPWEGLRMYLGEAQPAALPAPWHLGSEKVGQSVMLSWEPVPKAALYHVFRRKVIDGPAFSEIGTTSRAFFVDSTLQPRRTYHYYVVAESASSELSPPSNLARSPSLISPLTLTSLEQTVKDWAGLAGSESQGVAGITPALETARNRLDAGDLEGALAGLEQLYRQVGSGRLPMPVGGSVRDLQSLRLEIRQRLAAGDLGGALDLLLALRTPAGARPLRELSSWRKEDLKLFLGRLIRRFELAQAGLLSPLSLK